jgi:hypothetical protein
MAQPDDTENRDTAILDVCTVKAFTAKELREDMDACMDAIRALDEDGDLDELRIYAKEFLVDVDDRYPEDEDSESSTSE